MKDKADHMTRGTRLNFGMIDCLCPDSLYSLIAGNRRKKAGFGMLVLWLFRLIAL